MKAVFLALAFLALHGTRTAGQIRNLDDAINQFSVHLFQAALNDEPRNLVISPLGVYMGLAGVLYGATNVTKRELEDFLHLSEEDLSEHVLDFGSIVTTLDLHSNVFLFLNKNRVFVKPSVSPTLRYENILDSAFHSSVERVDFTDTIATAELINDWSNQSTSTFIDKIVNPDELDEKTAVLIINAVYLFGEWATSFALMRTGPARFYVDEYTTKKVSMMYLEGMMNYGYLPQQKANFVVLPSKLSHNTEGLAVNVYFILPETSEDLQHTDKTMYSLTLHDLNKTEEDVINLRIPKFEIDTIEHFRNYFKRLRPFSQGDHFQGMPDESGPLKIKDLIQRTRFSVHEKGINGPAPDKDGIMPVGPRLRIKGFWFNRPFFVVVATENLILLTGKVMDPSIHKACEDLYTIS